MQVIPLTCALGAELTDVNLADAARDEAVTSPKPGRNGGMGRDLFDPGPTHGD